MRVILFLIMTLALLTSCTKEESNPLGNGGVEVIEEPAGRTVIVNGGVITIALTATYRLGFATILVSLTNNTGSAMYPTLVGIPGYHYCYIVRVLNERGDTLSSKAFGLDEFEEQFDSSVLAPGLTYTEYEYVYPWQIPNNPTKGKFQADVWVSYGYWPPDTIRHVWAQVDFEISDD